MAQLNDVEIAARLVRGASDVPLQKASAEVLEFFIYQQHERIVALEAELDVATGTIAILEAALARDVDG